MTRPERRFYFRLGVLLFVIVSISSCADRRGVRTPATRYSTEFGGVYHVVEKGQTLWRIARAYNVDLETVQWINEIEDTLHSVGVYIVQEKGSWRFSPM